MILKNGRRKVSYLAGQLDFTTNPFKTNVFMQLHPVYQSLVELANCPGFPLALSGLLQIKRAKAI